jgi:EmrB/QacA subfamily drug resistance transporter
MAKFKFETNLFSICLCSFLVPFMGSALNLCLPKIGQEFSMNAVTLTWVSTAYLIATAIFQIPMSKIADIFGRKRLYIIGLAIVSVATFACGLAQSTTSLLIFRIIAGIGSAITMGNAMAILMSLYPAEMRGKILGINTSVVYAALAAGPFIGGMLTDYLGWRSLFYVTGVTAALIFILSIIFLKGEWKEAKGEIFDFKGSIFFAIALFGIIYGFTTLRNFHGIIWLGIGILATILFVIYEKRQIFPVLNIKLFSGNRVFALSTLAALINYTATSGIGFLLSLYLQYIRGMEAKHAGLILICQAVVQSICALLSGRLSDKIHPSRLATLGMIIIVIGLTGLIFLSSSSPIWFIICLLLLLGIGFGIFSSPNTNVIMGSVEKRNIGQASATTGTARLLGQTFSLGIAGMVIAFTMGDSKIIPDVFPNFMISMRITFIIFVGLCLVGIYASSARINKNSQ